MIQLAADQIDLDISTPPSARTGLVFNPLLPGGMVLLLPPNHPLQERIRIVLSDLHGECLLLKHPPCAYRAMIEHAFLERGFLRVGRFISPLVSGSLDKDIPDILSCWRYLRYL